MKLRIYFSCNSDQPRWLNRLRFTYLIPVATLGLSFSLLMLLMLITLEFITGIGELKVAWINSGQLIKAVWKTVSVDLWRAIKTAWNMGT